MKITLPLLTITLGLISCHDQSPVTSRDDSSPDSTIIVSSETFGSTAHQQDSIPYDEVIYPMDTLYPGRILTTGFFHGDEVWPDVESETWWGLLKKGSIYYLSQVKLKAERVHDPVIDEDMELDKTAWEITTLAQDTTVLLITGLNFLQEHTIEPFVLPKEYLLPGDSLVFNYGGQHYILFATGEKKKVQTDPEWHEVWKYKLYLSTHKNGKTITQLLVSQPHFDDAITNIIFAGDIDGDTLLDLIMDTSSHYNATTPTLYLSRPAAEAELLKIAGMHTSVGC